MYVSVIVRNNSTFVDNFFTYKVPKLLENEVEVGKRVIVPFGIGNKKIEGFIFEVFNEYSGEFTLKDVVSILDKEVLLTKEDIELINFMKKKYLCTYMGCISLFYPKGYTVTHYKIVELIDTNFKEKLEIIKSNTKSRKNDYMKLVEQVLEKLIKSKNKVKLEKFSQKSLNRILQDLVEQNVVDIYWEANSLKNEKKIKVISLNNEFSKVKLPTKQQQILDFMVEKTNEDKNYEVLLTDVKELLKTTDVPFKGLSEKGIINIVEKDIYREVKNKYIVKDKNIELNDEQQAVIKTVKDEMFIKNKKPYLLHGVTGSGKTEVYMDIIENALKNDLDSIVLVPEISLTPQTISRFTNKFGNIVGVFHSRLSDGERHDVYRKVKSGEIKILVGARSALFAPFKSLGVVIVDECHESSYKSDSSPKYNAIEVAKYLVFKRNITLVLGSATPSVEDYYKAKNNDYTLLELKSRANQKEMPKIEVVDMKEELNKGNGSILSSRLVYAMRQALRNNNQVMLFLNRRGYSNFVSCRKCSYVFKCDNCDISLTYHKHSNEGICHYCGHSIKIPPTCPECSSKYISPFGIGTQKVEEEVKKIFKDAKILRMDRDTTNKKDDFENILNEFKNKEANILIGTQMISKGLDFEDVVLVGILSGDMILNTPDFKSAETTFQLVTQVAGRCGRGEKEGQVILQGYEHTHYAIKRSIDYDYVGFYNEEIKLRKMFGYSPFVNMMSVVFSGENETMVEKNAKVFYDSLIYLLKSKNINNFGSIHGPNPCPIAKINKNFRYQVLFKDDFIEINLIKGIIMYICIDKRDEIFSKEINISIDINPNSII
ncbi:MAG: primosomal protein N' [Peptostreptococcaceae bacterium]